MDDLGWLKEREGFQIAIRMLKEDNAALKKLLRELENLRELEKRVRHSQIGKYNLYICEALAALEEKP